MPLPGRIGITAAGPDFGVPYKLPRRFQKFTPLAYTANDKTHEKPIQGNVRTIAATRTSEIKVVQILEVRNVRETRIVTGTHGKSGGTVPA